MRWVLRIVAGIVVVVIAVMAGALAFDNPVQPPPVPSITGPADKIDFSDLPQVQYVRARDGTDLAYRVYKGTGTDTVVLLHGATASGGSMHAVAKALSAAGATVYVPDLRGHGRTGKRGDIAYLGQLEDDMADFMAVLGPKRAGERRTLAGFSAGGGFALRLAAEAGSPPFDRYVLISSGLGYKAPTRRDLPAKFFDVALPRFIAIDLLDAVGIHACDGLPVIAFAVSPRYANAQTGIYSYRLIRNFGPHDDYAADVRNAKGPLAFIVGENDDFSVAGKYESVIRPLRPDAKIEIVPGMNHTQMIAEPDAIKAVTAMVLAK